jgi:putative transposase
LRGPEKWIFYYLYVILDLFSRYVVGWMVAERQCGELAKHLIAETCEKEGIVGGLTIHADRGSPMKAKPTIPLIAELGLIRSHSRPRTSDDNPFSESQ